MKYLSFLLLIVFLGSLLIPYSSLAAGLVPCGGEGEQACQICHLFVMINGVWSWLLGIVAGVGALMLIISGYFLLTAGGNPKQLGEGKKVLTATIAGLVIIFGAFMIVNAIFSAMGAGTIEISGNPVNWFQIDCPI